MRMWSWNKTYDMAPQMSHLIKGGWSARTVDVVFDFTAQRHQIIDGLHVLHCALAARRHLLFRRDANKA